MIAVLSGVSLSSLTPLMLAPALRRPLASVMSPLATAWQSAETNGSGLARKLPATAESADENQFPELELAWGVVSGEVASSRSE